MLIPHGGPVRKMAVLKKIWPYAVRHALFSVALDCSLILA